MRFIVCNLPLLLLGLLLPTSCHNPKITRGNSSRSTVKSPTAGQTHAANIPAKTVPPPVLIVYETDDMGAKTIKDSATALQTLISHFDLACTLTPISNFRPDLLWERRHVFYLAGHTGGESRAKFITESADFGGTMVWVGPGLEALGDTRLAVLGLNFPAESQQPTAPALWTVSYRHQQYAEKLSLPDLGATETTHAVAYAKRGNQRRPFIAGSDKLWYAAVAPELRRERFWTTCIWADVLHDILGEPAHGPRRLVPVLRDVPVWTNDRQVPDAIAPFLQAGMPVGVLASTEVGDVALADRPDAVRGLRRAETLGAAMVLATDAKLDAKEHLRLAWEVRLHPVAWEGPADLPNPFRIRISEPDSSPPYSAGGLIAAPIKISDAGYVSAEDMARLAMQTVVRDAVALVSFGLWAPPEPFLSWVRDREKDDWIISDLRDLGVYIFDGRRIVTSRQEQVWLSPGSRYREIQFTPKWELKSNQTIVRHDQSTSEYMLRPPERGVTILERIKEMPARPFLTAVTLDPNAYLHSGLSAKDLAGLLAEHYLRNGVNTVFYYAYNVNEGAAYRTRYKGATVSYWGRQDFLGSLLTACHSRGIRVVAWMYSARDRGRWLKKPKWRELTKNGKPYNPLKLHAPYFLCPNNPEVQEWFAGLIRDLARSYPTLDGIELCEPLVNWFGDLACYCDVCRRQFAEEYPKEKLGGEVWRKFRAEGLTRFLSRCFGIIAEHHIDSYLMTITDAWSNGAILTPRRQVAESGLDLEALLDGPHPPDWVNFEVIWQQWAAIYSRKIFYLPWAEETAHRVKRRVDERARVMFHVELVDFKSERVTPVDIAHTIQQIMSAEPDGIECFHSGALDKKSGWGAIRRIYQELP